MSLYSGKEASQGYYEILPEYISPGDEVVLISGGRETEGEVESISRFPPDKYVLQLERDEDTYIYFERGSSHVPDRIDRILVGEQDLRPEQSLVLLNKAESIAEALEGRLDEV